MNAAQGAAAAGAKRVVAVDPVELKREKSFEFGATDAYLLRSPSGENTPRLWRKSYTRTNGRRMHQ